MDKMTSTQISIEIIDLLKDKYKCSPDAVISVGYQISKIVSEWLYTTMMCEKNGDVYEP